jgi:hypothetical protein
VGDDELEAINDRKTMAERVAALCGFLAVGSAAFGGLPVAVTATAGGVALVALIAAWRFSVEAAAERRRIAQAAQARERADVAQEREAAITAALRTDEVRPVADSELAQLGVDAVDPRVLERALQVDGDQLAYVRRDVDDELRDNLRGPVSCRFGR